MKSLMYVVAMMLFITPLAAQADQHSTLYAVKFHADWCGSCKKLAPVIAKARVKADLDSKNVLFVTLDLTNKTASNQAKLMANAIGIGEFYAQNNGKTGFVLLVDSATGKEVGRITKEMNADEVVTMIQEKAKAL